MRKEDLLAGLILFVMLASSGCAPNDQSFPKASPTLAAVTPGASESPTAAREKSLSDQLSERLAAAHKAFDGGAHQEARSQGLEALDLAAKLKNQAGLLDSQQLLAEVALRRGRTDEALRYWKALPASYTHSALEKQVVALEQAATKGSSSARATETVSLILRMADLHPDKGTIELLNRAIDASEKLERPKSSNLLKEKIEEVAAKVDPKLVLAVTRLTPIAEDYFPAPPDAQWDYRRTYESGGQYDHKVSVEGNAPEVNADYNLVLKVTHPKSFHHLYYKKSRDSVRYLGSLASSQSEWSYQTQGGPILISFPPKVGRTWQYEGKSLGGMDLDRTETSEVQGQEEVSVPAGKFTCVRIRRIVKAGSRERASWSTNNDETIWFAKGVGIVKHVTKSKSYSNEMVLLKYSMPNL